MTLNSTKITPVQTIAIAAEQSGRRIDNFLLGYFGNIPKTRIYKMLRKGEVRVNGGRTRPEYRLQPGDCLRLPPVYIEDKAKTTTRAPKQWLKAVGEAVVYEDGQLLLLNKPSGIAVHGGSGEVFGVIELLRQLRPGEPLELVHRLDKATSGCLLLAKEHRVLRALHTQLRDSSAEKHYLALLKGQLPVPREVDIALNRNVRVAGERRVQPDNSGKHASSYFEPLESRHHLTLARVRIMTGRTHQIRVHAAAIDHPVAGDDKYGDREFNRQLRRAGLKRMFLHAEALAITHPRTGKIQNFTAPLDRNLATLLPVLLDGDRNA